MSFRLAPSLVLLLALSACGDAPSAASQTLPQQARPDEVVAEVNGRKVTLKEVDAKWEEFDAAERAKVNQLLYQNRRNMLGELLGDILIAEAAKAAALPVDDYLKQETARRVRPVTEDELLKFYEENKERAPGRSLDQLRGPMKAFMENDRALQARAQLVQELEKKGSVKILLEPPRYAVAVAPDDPVRGNREAAVTIVEFSEYQCPFCARVNPALAKVLETYGNKVRIVFKDFPLPNHPQAPKAAEAAHCAAEQGKYWEMHDVMFANQRALEVPSLKRAAAGLGLDTARFDRCLDSGQYASKVAAGLAQGEKLGVNSTPTLYINGRPVIGAQPYEVFKAAIDEELKRP
jgi:protein-disulfide isomerase